MQVLSQGVRSHTGYTEKFLETSILQQLNKDYLLPLMMLKGLNEFEVRWRFFKTVQMDIELQSHFV